MSITDLIRRASKDGKKVSPEIIDSARRWFNLRWEKFLESSVRNGENTWWEIISMFEGFIKSVYSVTEDTEHREFQMKKEFYEAALPAFYDGFFEFLSEVRKDYAIKTERYNGIYALWHSVLIKIMFLTGADINEDIKKIEKMWKDAKNGYGFYY